MLSNNDYKGFNFFNLEGLKRNKFYLSNLVSEYKPLFLFIQEHWLPYHDASYKFDTNFDGYEFLATSSDMFTPVEDRMLESGPIWHGTALGWDTNIDHYVSKIPVISERFCGLTYSNNHTNIIAYTAYMPTSGQDDEFLEVLSKLSFDIMLQKIAAL